MLQTKNEGNQKTDPRVKRTRLMIEQAFMKLINEKGFQDVTVQDITERAGINRATFYAHFTDKYALLDFSIRQAFLQEIEKRMLRVCQFSLPNLQHLITAVCEFVKSTNAHCKPAQVQFETLVETQVKGVLYDILIKWLESAKIDIPPETAATAGSWAIYGLALQWSHQKHPRPVDEFAREVLPLIASNLNLAGIP